jgi:hypothetical protein
LTIEHGPAGNKFPVDYSSVANYYAEKAFPQEAPTSELSAYPQPEVIVFHGIFLTVQALRNGKIVNYQRMVSKGFYSSRY